MTYFGVDKNFLIIFTAAHLLIILFYQMYYLENGRKSEEFHYLSYVSTFSDLKSKISLICDKVKLKIHFPYEAYIKAAD